MAIVKYDPTILTPLGIDFKKIKFEINYDNWAEGLNHLRELGRGTLWHWGDWLNYGEDNFEGWTQAVKESDYKEETLRLAQWVSRKMPFVARATNLSWRFHQEACNLEKIEDIIDILKQCEKEDWTIKQLRQAIRNKKAKDNITAAVGDGKVEIKEGDLFDIIEQVPDKSIDLLLTDPPYGVKDIEWDSIEDYAKFTNDWVIKIIPKLKDKYIGFIFCDYRNMFKTYEVLSQYFNVKNTLIWIRKNMALGRVIADQFISSYEVIFYFGTKDLNLPKEWGSERFDTLEFAVPQTNFTDTKVHPTQKPIDLIKQLVLLGSKENDIVLDCFGGAGTTGVACKELNRDCILIENNEEYIDIIKRRIG